MEKIIEENLRRLRILNEEQSDTGKEIDQGLLIELFLMDSYELGLKLHQGYFQSDSPDFIDYLQESFILLHPFKHRINNFIKDTESILKFAFQADEWLDVCRRRSAIEFIREFSKGTRFERSANELDTQVLDDQIKKVGETEGYLNTEEIPKSMPTSHWWWWYPSN